MCTRQASAILAMLTFTSFASGAEWGSLRAKFVLFGERPKAEAIRIIKPGFCQAQRLRDEGLIVNRSNRGIQNVVVMLEPRDGEIVPIHDEYKRVGPPPTLFASQCQFTPRVLHVRPGQGIRLSNLDPVAHAFYLRFFRNEPVNPILPPKKQFTVSAKKSERLPIDVSCSNHPWMRAWIIVSDSPYVGISNAVGELEIKRIPQGKWLFRIWHEWGDELDLVRMDGKWVELSRRGAIEFDIRGDLDLGKVEIPVASFPKAKFPDTKLATLKGSLVAKNTNASIQINDADGTTTLWRVDKESKGLGGVLVSMAPWNKEERVAESYTGAIPKTISLREMEEKLKNPDYRVSEDLLRNGVVAFNDDTVRPAIAGVYEGQKILVVNESHRPKKSVWVQAIKTTYPRVEMPPRSVRQIQIVKGERYLLATDLVKSRARMRMLVMRNPLWAITASDGTFTIPEVPQGDYRITAMRYDSINLRTGRVDDTSDPLRIKVADSDLTLDTVPVLIQEN